MQFGARYSYSRWDGSQNPWDLDEDAVMDAMADDLIAHGDVQRALRNLFQRGFQDRQGNQAPGLRDLMERLRQQRQQQLERYNLDSVVNDLKERLDDVLKTEREGIDRRLEEAREQLNNASAEEQAQQAPLMNMMQERAGRNREKLDDLPEDMAGAIKELQEYDFMDPDAQHKFQELMDLLRQQMLQNVTKDMKERIQGMGQQEMAAMGEMLQDLNNMMRDKMSGLEPDFEGFMDKWGSSFGDNPPQSFDELMEMMRQQMGQAQSLLDSMSPEQRQELFDAMSAAMDDATAQQMLELAMNMSELFPGENLGQQYPFMGNEDVTLDQAMDVMSQLQAMDNLERQIQQIMRQGNVEDIDLDQVEQQLGEEARNEMERLQQLAKRLEEAGLLQMKGDKLSLSPHGIRKIAQKALKDLFDQLTRSRRGDHAVHERGAGGENTDDTKRYEFGDAFELDLQKTVMNGVLRAGTGTPVQLTPEDFEIRRTEQTAQAATVLLLDQSRSMGLFGSFTAAKKVALALYALIKSHYPKDAFYILGFSDYAIELKGDELPQITWNAWVSGTNMQHAFMMSRKLLSRYKNATRQIIMITDGEPTAHLEGDRTFFSYPPTYRTIQETLKEAKRCTQEGITINTFMLETSHYLLDFVDQMTRINRGRALYTTPDSLGQYVLVDYISNRKRRLAG